MITEFAPAKINLALHVLGRRADGFHELDSIVAFADVGDRLTLVRSDKFDIVASGPFGADLPRTMDNIVYRAWEALAGEFPGLAPVRIQLEKNLPISSGIGGGSANAAATLRGLMKLYGFTVPDPNLRRIALSLGADVPVCLPGRAARMQGIGERITPFESFKPLHAVLVNPGVPVATAEVFGQLGLAKGARYDSAIGDNGSWRNDLTAPAIRVQPAIAEVIAAVPQARLSGSGATCFAIVESRGKAAEVAMDLQNRHPTWWIKDTTIGG